MRTGPESPSDGYDLTVKHCRAPYSLIQWAKTCRSFGPSDFAKLAQLALSLESILDGTAGQATGAEAVNDMSAMTEAIADIVVARDSHEEWARYLRTHPSPEPQEVKIAGDADYHVVWVGKYERVLTILRARRNSLRSRSRHA